MCILNTNLKNYRKSKGLTQKQFAEILNIKQSKLGSYEENRARPTYELVIKISDVTGHSIDELLTTDIYNSGV